MTDSNYTHILVISDRSGSMNSPVYKHNTSWDIGSISDYTTLAQNMEKALQALFKEQAAIEGKCLVDFVEFDDVYNIVYQNRDVKEATAGIVPRNATALNDAIGKAVTQLGQKLEALPEVHRPGHVIVAIVTDGLENASREWTKATVKELIKQQTDTYNWVFTFLGANMDAIAEADSYGIQLDTALDWSPANLSAAVGATSNFVSNVRGGNYGVTYHGYSDEERAASK